MFLEIAFNLPVNSTYTYAFSGVEDLPAIGCRVKAQLGARHLVGWIVGHTESGPAGVKEFREPEKILDVKPLFDARSLELAQWLSKLCLCSLGEALSVMTPGGKREARELPVEDDDLTATEPVQLNDEQEVALKAIVNGGPDWFYMYGITGSGKTEVFLRAAEDAIAHGKSVIYLVPEIALSHQLVEGLRVRFNDSVAVIHSGLTPSRRLSEWRRIQDGNAQLVIGARSAVFAPLPNLGLIIIDEEHESSYKSGATPRFHARQVAMRRCREEGASLVMGSATPSVEAWKLMADNRLKRLSLSERPAGGAAPAIRVIDLRKEKGLFSAELVQSMSRVLSSGRQVLLFLNRRGFSYHYSCRSCGHELLCRNCSVALTFHKSANSMICHYCGFHAHPPQFCPECRSTDIGAAGFGTEKVEEEVARLFPEYSAFRLDADAVKKKGVLATALKDFRTGKINILMGTQMVAKGLNAPGVKLAAVLLADTTLNLPDFRSAERSFALIVQVAGRAGRFAPDGEVLVQTFRPDSVPIRLAAEGEIERFYDYELEQRRILGFPPYSRLFRVVFKGVDEERVRRSSEELASRLQSDGRDWELLGPAECPLGKISGRFRRHILLRSQSFDRTHAALDEAIEATGRIRGVRLEIDIDPVSLL